MYIVCVGRYGSSRRLHQHTDDKILRRPKNIRSTSFFVRPILACGKRVPTAVYWLQRLDPSQCTPTSLGFRIGIGLGVSAAVAGNPPVCSFSSRLPPRTNVVHTGCTVSLARVSRLPKLADCNHNVRAPNNLKFETQLSTHFLLTRQRSHNAKIVTQTCGALTVRLPRMSR